MSKFKAVLIILFFATILLLKVYISNEIYYISRDIHKMTVKVNALKEEQNLIRLEIEKLEYKNRVIDPLFNYEQLKTKMVYERKKREEEEKLKKQQEEIDKLINEDFIINIDNFEKLKTGEDLVW